MSFAELTGANNPFAAIDIGNESVPTFVDVDGDGDLDLVVGGRTADLDYFRNMGGGIYVQQTGSANPFNSFNIGNSARNTAPAAIDVEGDGDLDLVVGSNYGDLMIVRNDGAGQWTQAGILAGVAVSNLFSAPTAADIDGDGDRDLVLGDVVGSLAAFRNNGGGSFTQLTGVNNPFAGIQVDGTSAPAFVDVDADGDRDLVVGDFAEQVRVYLNTTGIYALASAGNNPFAGFDFDATPAFTFVDIDGDGDLDGVAGSTTGTLRLFRNDAATAGNDFFNLSQIAEVTASGGLGDDGFYLGAALSAGDVLDGGAGASDQLGLQGNYLGPFTLAAGHLTGIEQLVLLAGNDTRFGDVAGNSYSYHLATIDANVGAGQILQVNFNALRVGENVTFNGSAETDGGFLTFGGLGNDTLTGGTQNDGFFFGTGRFGAGDSATGGSSTGDEIGLQGDYAGANALVFGAGQLAGIELLACLTASDARFHGDAAALYSYTLTMNDGNVANGALLTIAASTLIAGEVLTFNGAAESDGRFTVFSGNGNDTITTGAGNDRISGRGGADQLTGNGGADTFLYTNLTDSTAGSQDHILDFRSGDVIDLSALDANSLVGGNDAFSFIGGAAFSGAGQLRVSASSGDWLVEGDTDGNGVADISILLTVPDAHAITGADFLL